VRKVMVEGVEVVEIDNEVDHEVDHENRPRSWVAGHVGPSHCLHPLADCDYI
jgi:hypothetical protein